jgi:hypothetical protein
MAVKKNQGPEQPASQVPMVPPKQEVVDYGSYNGMGFEGTSQDDYAMPFLNLLQTGSPEVGAEGPDKAVEGARPGMFVNSVTKELYDGQAGLIFVPCATQQVFVEWKPRSAGGGIVGRHEHTSDLVVAAKRASKEFGKYQTDEGHDLVQTFYMIGFTLRSADDLEPTEIMVIPFSSTKIKPYQAYMGKLRSYQKIPQPPLFSHRLRLTSFADRNNKGNFFNVKLEPINGGVRESSLPLQLDGHEHPLIAAGALLCRQFLAGTKRMADDSVASDDAPKGANGKPLF